MSLAEAKLSSHNAELLRCFLRKIVDDDVRAKQLFRLFYDRGEISEAQFFAALERYQK